MNNGLNVGWILGGGALIVLLLFYFFFMNEANYDWYESYDESQELPYGSSVFKSILEKHTNDQLVSIDSNLVSSLSEVTAMQSNYIIIGSTLYYDSLETNSLIDYVKRGNSALLISNDFSSLLLNALFESTQGFNDDLMYVEKSIFENYSDTAIYLNIWAGSEVFKEPVACVSLREQEPYVKYWRSFSEDLVLKVPNSRVITIHGFFNQEYPNFIEVPCGDGRFLLHSSPMAFSNIQLLKEQSFEYVNQIVSYLDNKPILWDGYNREYQTINDPNFDADRNSQFNEGPLAFILSTKSLRRSWYILIGLATLFLFFGAKRLQQPIDIVRPLSNTSIEYAKTIGTMLRMENNHQNLVEMKFRHWKVFIFERYGLRVPEETDSQTTFIEKLSMKSDLKESEIIALFTAHRKAAYNPALDIKGLVEFHHTLDNFYKNCR